MKPRPYQTHAIAALVKNALNKKNTLYVLPCRGGKTVIVSQTIKELIAHGKVCTFLAHRNELVVQNSATLARAGIHHAIIGNQAMVKQCIARHRKELGASFVRTKAMCCVAAVDTLVRHSGDGLDAVDVWVVDECHHILESNKWGKCLEKMPRAVGIGVTATPVRGDKKQCELFGDMVLGPSHPQLEEMGFLAPYSIYISEEHLQLADHKTEFTNNEITTAIHASGIIGNAPEVYGRIAGGKRAIAYVADIETANEFAEAFNSAGWRSLAVSSKSPPELRDRAVRELNLGILDVLVNVDLFSEGIDVPELEVVIMLRPTQSFGLFYQQFCRCLNPQGGLKQGIIIDHVGNIMRHIDDWERRVVGQDWINDKAKSPVAPVKICPECGCMVDGYPCPVCGYVGQAKSAAGIRSRLEVVEGNIEKMPEHLLARMRRAPPSVKDVMIKLGRATASTPPACADCLAMI